MKEHRNVSPRQEMAAERKLFEAMADRWVVVEYLQRGLPYREIHKLTGVSVTTIGRVAKFVAAGNGGYELALRRVDGGSRRNGDAAKRTEAAGHG